MRSNSLLIATFKSWFYGKTLFKMNILNLHPNMVCMISVFTSILCEGMHQCGRRQVFCLIQQKLRSRKEDIKTIKFDIIKVFNR